MKKYYLCFFLLLSITIFAQDEDFDDEPGVFAPLIVKASEAYVGLRVGMAFTTDDFSTTGLKSNAGFAKSGYQIGLDGAFIFARNIGLGWNFGHARNGVKSDEYPLAIRQILPTSFKNESLTGDLTFQHWRSTWLMIGPYFSLPEQKFMFDFGLYVGLANTVMPEMTYTGIINRQVLEYSLQRDGSIGFAAMIQASGNIHLQDNIRLYLRTSLYNSYPKLRFDEAVKMDTYNINTLGEHRQVVALVNLAVGVAYEFQRSIDPKERRAVENARKEKERQKARKKWAKQHKMPKAKKKKF